MLSDEGEFHMLLEIKCGGKEINISDDYSYAVLYLGRFLGFYNGLFAILQSTLQMLFCKSQACIPRNILQY
jgi:hypothetical protein